MKVVLIHNLDMLTKEAIIKNYKDNGYQEIWSDEENHLLKLGDEKIPDLETYLKVLSSFLKSNHMTNQSRGRIIELTKAFEYAYKSKRFNKFDNHFTWYLRNSIIAEVINQ